MTKERLDLRMRQEIATEVWRIFGLMARKVAFTFDEDGITIRVPFNEPKDLDGPVFISGYGKGVEEYFEIPIGRE